MGELYLAPGFPQDVALSVNYKRVILLLSSWLHNPSSCEGPAKCWIVAVICAVHRGRNVWYFAIILLTLLFGLPKKPTHFRVWSQLDRYCITSLQERSLLRVVRGWSTRWNSFKLITQVRWKRRNFIIAGKKRRGVAFSKAIPLHHLHHQTCSPSTLYFV